LAATYVTQQELRTALGIGSLYSDSVVEEVAQSAQDIVSSYLWKNEYNNYAHSSEVGSGTLYFNDDITDKFYVGMSVVISNNGTKFNGTKTLTGVSTDSITMNTTHTAVQPKHLVQPYGTVLADTYVDYSTVPAVREASLMIAVDIWQARQASNAGGISPDFQPSPYRMGNTLLARVRGLLAPYLSPNSLVG